MTRYGVATDYEYTTTHKRERIVVWSGPSSEVYEAEGYSLPNDAGYMLTTYNGDKIRVETRGRRTEDTYRQVDAAIQEALTAHWARPRLDSHPYLITDEWGEARTHKPREGATFAPQPGYIQEEEAYA